MTSKMEYLQRYMSGSSRDTAAGASKKKKKVKKAKTTEAVTCMVDSDQAWEELAPSREEIEKKWEMDVAEDELPLVVAVDDGELVDPQDLPVFVDSDKYLNDFNGTKCSRNECNDEDLSPPRKKTTERNIDASGDASPRRRRSTAATASRQDTKRRIPSPSCCARNKKDDSEEWGGSATLSKKSCRDVAVRPSVKSPVDDASPPRKPRRDRSDSGRHTKRSRDLPTPSAAVLDYQCRVDSLGRDIPSCSIKKEKHTRVTSAEPLKDSKCRTRSRSQSRDRGRASRGARNSYLKRKKHRSHSGSPRPRRRRSRYRSIHRRRSSRSSRRSFERPDTRIDRSRSSSRERRSSRCETKNVKKARSADDQDARSSPHAAAQSACEFATRSKKEEARGKLEKASDGKEERKSGLFTAAEFENQRKIAAKQKDVLRGVDASAMGANAATVYRDKRGRKLDMLNELVRQQEVLEGKRKREEREEYEWGTGEVQKRERKSQQKLVEQMKSLPFARHEDDEGLERKRRERVRAFDPVNSKVFQENVLTEGHRNKKKSKKDKTTSKAKPKYAGPPAIINRFGIQPGYRWDGVVRGTNWEEKLMMRQNANAAVSEEAYKYAVADM